MPSFKLAAAAMALFTAIAAASPILRRDTPFSGNGNLLLVSFAGHQPEGCLNELMQATSDGTACGVFAGTFSGNPNDVFTLNSGAGPCFTADHTLGCSTQTPENGKAFFLTDATSGFTVLKDADDSVAFSSVGDTALGEAPQGLTDQVSQSKSSYLIVWTPVVE